MMTKLLDNRYIPNNPLATFFEVNNRRFSEKLGEKIRHFVPTQG